MYTTLFAEPIMAELISLRQLSELADFGMFGLLALVLIKYFTSRDTRATSESWELLESLVRSHQEANLILTKNNQTLIENARPLAQVAELTGANRTLVETNHELTIQLKELSQYGG